MACDLRGALAALLGVADDEDLPFAAAVELEADPHGTIERAWERCEAPSLIWVCLWRLGCDYQGQLGSFPPRPGHKLYKKRGLLRVERGAAPPVGVITDTDAAARARARNSLPWMEVRHGRDA